MGRRDCLQPQAPDDLPLAHGARTAELACSLALATDLSYGEPFGWVMRSCLLALRLAERAGLSVGERHETYYVTLLAYAGCSASSHRLQRIAGSDIALRRALARLDLGDLQQIQAVLISRLGHVAGMRALRALVDESAEITAGQCDVSRYIAGEFGLPERIQRLLLQVYERWDGAGGPHGLRGDAIERPVRVAQIALDLGLICHDAPDAVIAFARSRAGTAFDPVLVACFVADAGEILAAIDVASSGDAVLASEPTPWLRVSSQRFDGALGAFADVADLKLPFTVGRSRRVADVVRAAVTKLGWSSSAGKTVERAALVQDIGRLGIASSTWEKPGTYTDADWDDVRLHPYYSGRILSRANDLRPLARLAGLHHERLDGSGYPLGVTGEALGEDARLLAAADTWEALRADRPHRAAHARAGAEELLERDARDGKLDADVVQAVLGLAPSPVAGQTPRPAGLTAREAEVLSLLARGLTNREIAAQLGISAKTVGHHIEHVYNRIGVASRAGATLWATQVRLV